METDETATLTTQTDFIVIGAGSAGCILARTLVEAGFHVAIVEAGQPAEVDRTPANYLRLFGSMQDWAFETVPQDHLAKRKIRTPRGRGPGGSTRINAMIWYPPMAQDFQNLQAAGGDSWATTSLRDSLARVTDWVRPESPRFVSAMTHHFVSAANDLGFVASPFERMTRNGERRTAHDILLESKAMGRLSWIDARANRILIDGPKATGVEVITDGTTSPQRIIANRAVILCGGAIQSPELLLLSGIGPAEKLKACGIEPLIDLPSVGEHLCDHLIMPVIYSAAEGLRFPASPVDDHRWSNLAEAGGTFVGSDGTLFQFHFTPTHYLLHPNDNAPAAATIGVNLCAPRSRGRVSLSGNIDARSLRLEIDPAYLSDPSDRQTMPIGIEAARKIAAHSTIQSLLQEELIPGQSKRMNSSVHRSIERFSQSLYHPAGTCRLGSGRDAVVDVDLRVLGTQNLHVVDASILPTMPCVNPNALIMTIATHAGDRLSEIYSISL